jgi:hypothetical protein
MEVAWNECKPSVDIRKSNGEARQAIEEVELLKSLDHKNVMKVGDKVDTLFRLLNDAPLWSQVHAFWIDKQKGTLIFITVRRV